MSMSRRSVRDGIGVLRPRRAGSAAGQGLREGRPGVDAVHAGRRADGDHRAAHRRQAHRHPPRDVPDAPGAGRAPSTRRMRYFESIWKEDMHAVPRFLWNAKMRFGKTFASYQLAKQLGANRVLVVTFKPAVEDAWQTDLESHADFDGWQYLSSATGRRPRRWPTRRGRWSTSARSRTCSGETRPGTSRRRTSGSTRPTGTS